MAAYNDGKLFHVDFGEKERFSAELPDAGMITRSFDGLHIAASSTELHCVNVYDRQLNQLSTFENGEEQVFSVRMFNTQPLLAYVDGTGSVYIRNYLTREEIMTHRATRSGWNHEIVVSFDDMHVIVVRDNTIEVFDLEAGGSFVFPEDLFSGMALCGCAWIV